MKWDFRGRAVIQQILPHFKRASSVERTWALSGQNIECKHVGKNKAFTQQNRIYANQLKTD